MCRLLLITQFILAVCPSLGFSQSTTEKIGAKPDAVKWSSINNASRTAIERSVLSFIYEIANRGDDYSGIIVTFGPKTRVDQRLQFITKGFVWPKFDRSRIFFILGGNVSAFRTDFWIILPGAEPPKIEPEAYIFDQFEATRSANNLDSRIDDFYQKLNKDGLYQGYIINYGRPSEIAFAEKLIMSVRRTGCDINCSRLTFVNGGRGRKRLTVLWILPQGARAPAP